MENLKTIEQFIKDTETEKISEKKTINNFKNFDSKSNYNSTTNELKDYDLSKEDILAKRTEIANKISAIESELNTETEEIENIDDLEMQLENLKKEFKKIHLLVEKKVYTHKAIVRKK